MYPDFLEKPFKVNKMLDSYLQDIKSLSKLCNTAIEKQKLKTYYRAVKTIRDTSVWDKARYALAFARPKSGNPLKIRQSLPIVLGRQVGKPENIDIHYARLLLTYAENFQAYKYNLSDVVLKFVLVNPVSPIAPYFDRELQRIINDTEKSIDWYQAHIK